ncbi:hypothetical protein MBLNU459_g3178t1 [Dothideomycetes sp. NU459]
MFPVDCLNTPYVEDRMADDRAKEQAQQNKQTQKPAHMTIPQPTVQRPNIQTRTISSTLFGLFPSARQYQASSTNSTPSNTPMPSPRLSAPAKAPWFEPRPIPKATDMDVACLPPAWS